MADQCGARNLLAYERQYRDAFSAAMTKELKEAAAREQAEQPTEREEDIEAVLRSVVARDSDRYLTWLLKHGYAYYEAFTRKQRSLSWEDWCKWFAPTIYEVCEPWPEGYTPVEDIYAFRGQFSERSRRILDKIPTISLELARDMCEDR